jgi:molybdopterin molybdotransferase
MRVGEFASALLSLATPLEPLDMPLLDAHGATLASDIQVDDRIVLPEGIRIRSTQIGLAATLGLDHLPTRPQPRVVVVALSESTSMTSAAATNSWLLTTAVKEAGALGYRVLLQADTASHIRAIIEDQLVRADLILVTGDEAEHSFDQVLEVLSRIGKMESVDVRYRRGGRHAYGTVDPEGTPVILLPGNPIAAYISTEIFVRPMIRQMMGLREIHRPVIRARLESEVRSISDYHDFLLASWTRSGSGADIRDRVSPLSDQESMIALAEANALIALSIDDEVVPVESEVDLILLERRYI